MSLGDLTPFIPALLATAILFTGYRALRAPDRKPAVITIRKNNKLICHFVLLGAICLSTLSGCGVVGGMFLSGVIGAAVAPVVQPVVDRGLVAVGAEWVDPAGTTAVKDFDKKP
jgi:hypothetical protein